jgi:uncharacterized membrane protein HdeD (DUF308 family)
MIARVFLAFQAILFIPYGLYCLLQPQMLADSAGLAATTITGTIELQAMYGGLQISVGVLCALAVFRSQLRRTALIALLFIFAGLAPVRVALGLTQGDFSFYTYFAMIFEALSLVFLITYLAVTRNSAGAVTTSQ